MILINNVDISNGEDYIRFTGLSPDEIKVEIFGGRNEAIVKLADLQDAVFLLEKWVLPDAKGDE